MVILVVVIVAAITWWYWRRRPPDKPDAFDVPIGRVQDQKKKEK